MSISDETWKRALDCAARQFESYARQGQLSTPAERRAALDDALQHAVGIIQMAQERRPTEWDNLLDWQADQARKMMGG